MKYFILLFYLILVSFVKFTLEGTLIPYGDDAISNTVANCKESANYTFSFLPDTRI